MKKFFLITTTILLLAAACNKQAQFQFGPNPHTRDGGLPQNPDSPQASQWPPAQDEAANWKTYRNEKYGFEVKYPKNWFVTEHTLEEYERSGYAPKDYLLSLAFGIPTEPSSDRVKWSFGIFNNSDNRSKGEIIKLVFTTNTEAFERRTEETVTYNDIRWTKLTSVRPFNEEKDFTQRLFYMIKDDKIYYLRDDGFTENFEALVKSFKFTK